MFKLDTISDTTDIVLTHPVTGVELEHEDGRKISITVLCTESKKYRDIRNKYLNRRIGSKKKQQTFEQMDAESIQLLVDSTVKLNNFDNVDFGSGPVDVDDIYRLYSENRWVRDQIDEGMADLGNFVVKASTKSKKS